MFSIFKEQKDQNEMQATVPVLPIRNSVIFPKTSMPIKVGRDLGIKAIVNAQKLGMQVITLTQKENLAKNNLSPEDLYEVGPLCSVDMVRNLTNGYALKVTGLSRVKVKEISETEAGLMASYEILDDILDLNPEEAAANTLQIKSMSTEILRLVGEGQNIIGLVESIEDLPTLVNFCAQNLNASVEQKQALLEELSLKQRSNQVIDLLSRQRESLKLQLEMNTKISDKVGKAHRDFILREQLRTIREELGEGNESSVYDEYFKKIHLAQMLPEVEKVAKNELKKLENQGPSSPESSIIRNYLDLLCSLPWKSEASTGIDLKAARAVLDQDHYGIQKIKDRIIQHLAVMKNKGQKKGSILLLVGPPGVGKTSLGKSIAKALGKKYVRVGLGGVRDDSEIRGHRRTYIGAMPGRIIQGIKKAGENNPVFLLDEIDKLSRSYGGDPAGALLEVLDPEQNGAFLDHYLDVPYDLSNVFFIATANGLDNIPGPLLDRMEVIELSGYTENEKLHIAMDHLVPKQLEEHGLEAGQLVIPREALKEIIHRHTREAGVRDLQRKIATVCRVYSERIFEAKSTQGDFLPFVVQTSELEDILGVARFGHETAGTESTPGVVTGLAWTPMGGDILFIESLSMPGTGKLILTGQLGDVMKESAQIALGLVRSRIFPLRPDYHFGETDIHIHVPSGAIPKDGPSAGIAITTALASLVLGKKVDSKLAMTGEVTLQGNVMPVGGIKEKVIAAHRASITTVILPSKNLKDLNEVPQEVKDSMQFHFVDNVSEVLKLALGVNWQTFNNGRTTLTPVYQAQCRPSNAN